MCKTARFFPRNTCKLFVSFTHLLMYDLFRPLGLISTDTHPWTVFAGGGSFQENSWFSTYFSRLTAVLRLLAVISLARTKSQLPVLDS